MRNIETVFVQNMTAENEAQKMAREKHQTENQLLRLKEQNQSLLQQLSHAKSQLQTEATLTQELAGNRLLMQAIVKDQSALKTSHDEDTRMLRDLTQSTAHHRGVVTNLNSQIETLKEKQAERRQLKEEKKKLWQQGVAHKQAREEREKELTEVTAKLETATLSKAALEGRSKEADGVEKLLLLEVRDADASLTALVAEKNEALQLGETAATGLRQEIRRKCEEHEKQLEAAAASTKSAEEKTAEHERLLEAARRELDEQKAAAEQKLEARALRTLRTCRAAAVVEQAAPRPRRLA